MQQGRCLLQFLMRIPGLGQDLTGRGRCIDLGNLLFLLFSAEITRIASELGCLINIQHRNFRAHALFGGIVIGWWCCLTPLSGCILDRQLTAGNQITQLKCHHRRQLTVASRPNHTD